MPYTPSDILTGLNPNTDFLLQLDTKQRMKNVFGDFKTPIQYEVPGLNSTNPEGFSQREIFNNAPAEDAIKKAVASPDPEIRQKAYDAIARKSNSQALNAGVGQIKFTPYYSWQDKYINDEYGYDPNVSQEANEAFYYKNQWESKNLFQKAIAIPSKFVGRVLPSALLKLGQGFGYIGAMGLAGLQNLDDLITGEDNHNFMKTIAENSFSRKFEEWENDLKNSSYLSVYKPQGWDKTGFWSKLTNASLWTDEFADGIAFLASAAIPGTAIGKLGKGVSLMANDAKFWNGAMRWFGTETLGDVGAVVYNTTSESLMEAAEGFKTYKQELINKREAGDQEYNNLSDTEIDRIAGDAAVKRFKANLLILSASNLFENKFFFKPIVNKLSKSKNDVGTKIRGYGLMDESLAMTEREKAKGIFGKFMGNLVGKDGKETFNWAARVPFYGKRFLSTTAMEGFWEENAQLAAERWSAQSAYQNSDGDKIQADKELYKQLYRQTVDALEGNDPENAMSIGLGGLVGILGGGAITKMFGGNDLQTGQASFWKGERKSKVESAKEEIRKYNQARQNMLSVNDVFKTDESGKKQFDENKINSKIDALNNYGFRQLTVDNFKDPILREKLQKDLFAEFIAAAVRGDVHKALLERLNTLPSVKAETLKELGLDPDSTINNPVEFAKRGITLVKAYESIQSTKADRPKGMSLANKRNPDGTMDYGYDSQEEERKYQAYLAYSRMLSSEDSRKTYQNNIEDEENKMKKKYDSFSEEYPLHLPRITRYNTLEYELLALKQAQKEFDFFDTRLFKNNLTNRINEIVKQQKAIKEDLEQGEQTKGNVSLQSDGLLTDKRYASTFKDALSLFANSKKFSQISVDEAVNNTIHQALTDQKNGLKNLESYMEYLGKRKVAEREADANPSDEQIKSDIEDLTQRKNNIEELKKINENSIPNETLTEEQIALNKEIERKNKELEENKPKTPKNRVESGVEEDGRFYVAVNDVKYFTLPDLMSADIPEYLFDKGFELFNKQAISQKEAKDALDRKEAQEQEEADNITATYSQSDETNYNNTLREEFEFNALAWFSRFKTVTMEGFNDSKISEELNANPYVQALSRVIKTEINLDIYEPVLTKDREEWLNRFSKEQAADIIDNNKLGMVLVFKEKGTDNYLKIGDVITSKSEGDKIIAHSIDDPSSNFGFNVHLSERHQLFADKMKVSYEEGRAKHEQDKLNVLNARKRVIEEGEELKVMLSYGGDGIIPTTATSDYVNKRFAEYGPQFAVVTSENIDAFPGSSEGQLIVNFPGKVAKNSQHKFFPVFTSSIAVIDKLTDTSVNDKLLARNIMDGLIDIIKNERKFTTKKDALNTIRLFLEKVVYTNKNDFFFRIIGEEGNYTIKYLQNTPEGEKEVKITNAKLNVNNKVYLGQERLYIPGKEAMEEVPTVDYREFINNRLKTYRKIVKNDENMLYLDSVNPYYNIQVIDTATPTILKETETVEEEKPVEEKPVENKKEEPKEDVFTKAKMELKEQETQNANTFSIPNLQIDLDIGTFVYTGGRKPTILKTTIEKFLTEAEQLQKNDENIIFGENKGFYYFGSRQTGTFVLFDAKLNPVIAIERFREENPEIYDNIINQCK